MILSLLSVQFPYFSAHVITDVNLCIVPSLCVINSCGLSALGILSFTCPWFLKWRFHSDFGNGVFAPDFWKRHVWEMTFCRVVSCPVLILGNVILGNAVLSCRVLESAFWYLYFWSSKVTHSKLCDFSQNLMPNEAKFSKLASRLTWFNHICDKRPKFHLNAHDVWQNRSNSIRLTFLDSSRQDLSSDILIWLVSRMSTSLWRHFLSHGHQICTFCGT